jgi:hypothetical protein
MKGEENRRRRQYRWRPENRHLNGVWRPLKNIAFRRMAAW